MPTLDEKVDALDDKVDAMETKLEGEINTEKARRAAKDAATGVVISEVTDQIAVLQGMASYAAQQSGQSSVVKLYSKLLAGVQERLRALIKLRDDEE